MWWLLWLACGPRPENYRELKAACEETQNGVACFADESATCVGGKIDTFEACDGATEVCSTGGGCEACPLTAAAETLAAQVVPPGASAEALTLARVPLGLGTDALASRGEITIDAVGAVSLWRGDGTALSLPFTSKPAEFPDLYVTAHGASGGTVTATFDNTVSTCAEVTVRITGVPFPGLAGKPLPSDPGFEWVDTFYAGAPVSVSLTTAALSGAAQVVIVPHRDAASWVANPALDPVTPAVTLSPGDGALSTTVAWDAAVLPAGELDVGYDVVLDRDGNGRLDPGDWLDGGDEIGFWVIADLTTAGPYAVTTGEASRDYWTTQRIYYPTGIDALGQIPLVMISHGNGHDYTWYDYLGEHLASWGFIVASHRNNTEPGIETASTTLLENTDWLVGHQATILGGALAGHLDGHRIGWVGHSRGGEGVVRAYDRLVDADVVPESYVVDDIKVVSSIAPTVFLDPTQSDPHDVPYHILFGAADGDVSGAAT